MQQTIANVSRTMSTTDGFEPHFGLQISKKNWFLFRSLVKIQHCGEPLWLRGSVPGLSPRMLKFRFLCLRCSWCTRRLLYDTFTSNVSFAIVWCTRPLDGKGISLFTLVRIQTRLVSTAVVFSAETVHLMCLFYRLWPL